MIDAKKIKKDFPILKQNINGHRLVYLDSAATTQKPRMVINEIKRYYEQYNANIHRGIHTLAELSTQAYEQEHERLAEFINADFQEVISTSGATESLNIVANSLTKSLKKGDKIVLTEMEHHSNIVPWQQIAKDRKLKMEFIKLDGFQLDMEHAKEVIDENAKIVAVMHASNVLGTINPVKKIGKLAHDAGALFVVDGAHSIPNMPIDVNDIGCDFFAFSGHKMCSPTGTGALFGKKELLEKMSPFLYGGHMISEVTLKDSRWNELPWKFEAGTANIAGCIGLGYAIDYLKKIGMKNIKNHEEHLAKYTIKQLEEIEDITIYGPQKGERTGTVSFNIKGIHTHDVAAILDKHGIAIRAGNHCAMPLMKILGISGCSRSSPYIYNIIEDIDKLVEAVKEAKHIFKV